MPAPVQDEFGPDFSAGGEYTAEGSGELGSIAELNRTPHSPEPHRGPTNPASETGHLVEGGNVAAPSESDIGEFNHKSSIRKDDHH